jgi:LysR family glycine cleavage system transcriptional activator
MTRKLPPLNGLRAFEAAARHLSFTRAAEELHVTQAAVSHQVKSLEDYLGIKLFRRFNRSLLLTDEGQSFLPGLTKAFDLLDDSARRLAKKEAGGALTVSVLPSFAARWLVARLGRFRRAHPEVDLRIDPNAGLADFAHGDVDIGIRYGKGNYPGLRSDRLMAEDIFPVCSPTLLEGEHPLRHPEDLAHHTLLHDDGHGDWRTWLLANEVKNVDPLRGTVFTDSSVLIEAAKQAQGVALARSVLAADELEAGTLVRPFGKQSVPAEYAYYIVCPEDTANLPKIKAFREWLLKEARSRESRIGNER